VGECTVTKSKKCAAGQEFNKEHALFFMEGILHRELFPSNTVVNSNFYCVVLRHMKENVL
jgi:hypothetical protein